MSRFTNGLTFSLFCGFALVLHLWPVAGLFLPSDLAVIETDKRSGKRVARYRPEQIASLIPTAPKGEKAQDGALTGVAEAPAEKSKKKADDADSPKDDSPNTVGSADGKPDTTTVEKVDALDPTLQDPSSAVSVNSREAVLARREAARRAAASNPNGDGTGGRGKGDKCLPENPKIKQLDDGRYQIEQSLVDKYTDDLKAAERLAYVSWHRGADGEIDGFKVTKLRCGGVLHQAGFRNGDVVTSVNGKEVTTILDALSAYRKLRNKRTLRVELLRKGQPVKLVYKLI